MSNRRHSSRRFRDRRPAAPHLTTVHGPADTLALVPYLFGFEPVESLVVVSLVEGGRRIGPGFRHDLPAADDRVELADQLGLLARRHGFTAVLLAAFSADPSTADPFVRLVLARLQADEVDVVDAFRGDGRRWWSYLCDDPACCPAEGRPYDPSASRVAAEAVFAGLSRAPDRESLRARFTPADPAARWAVATALGELRQTAAGLLDPASVRALVPAALAGALDPSAQASLLLALQHVPQRDEVWGCITRDNAEQHLAAWTELSRLAPDDLLPPVGSLAAFSAWLAGHGALAWHAVDRVLEVRPDYSMAVLVRRALESAVDPRAWTAWTE